VGLLHCRAGARQSPGTVKTVGGSPIHHSPERALGFSYSREGGAAPAGAAGDREMVDSVTFSPLARRAQPASDLIARST
jgi:hypothetical protein